MPKILLFSLAGIIVVLACVALFIAGKLENAGKQKYIKIKSGKAQRRKSSRILVDLLFDKPIIGGYLRWVRGQLFLGYTKDTSLNTRAAMLGFGSIISSVIVFLVIIKLYQADVFQIILFGFGCIYLNSIIIKSFVGNSDTKLLASMIDYIGDVKHYYHVTSMVDESIKQANLKAKMEILNQGTKIYNILTGASSAVLLKDYYDRCPNKFLKIFAGFSYLVKDYGDKKVDGISLYIKNLNYLTEEIQIEIIKKNQLSYWLKGLNVIVLFPLILPPIIEGWVTSSFPAVGTFYSSSLGFYVKCLLFLIAIICYVFIVQIQATELKTKDYNKKTWDYYLCNIGIVRFIVNVFAPRKNTVKYKKIQAYLEDGAGSRMTVEGLYLRRILYCVTAFIVMIFVFTTGHKTNIEKIMEDPAYGISNPNFYRMMGNLSEEDTLNDEKIRQLDASIISKFNIAEITDSQELLTAVKLELGKINYTDEEIDLAAQRITAKMVAIHYEYLRLWEIFISFIVAVIASFFPNLLLAFQSSLRKIDMEDEVLQFHTIIILLMHHDNVDVKVVLEWMKEFANIFKVPIELCLANFQNQNLALEKLKNDVNYKPFIKIVENMQMANEDISLAAAFDALELERNFYKENRKENNKQQINKKIEFGQMIGFIPVHSVLILYMALPIIITSFTAFSQIQGQLM